MQTNEEWGNRMQELLAQVKELLKQHKLEEAERILVEVEDELLAAK